MDVGILRSIRNPGGLTPHLIRAARSGVGMSILDLARSAQVSISTVHKVERDHRGGIDTAAVDTAVMAKIRRALEEAGADFFEVDDGTALRFRR